jgi:hypothetical protein
MSKETQHTMRIVVPGMLIVLLLAILKNPHLDVMKVAIDLDASDLAVGSAVIAAFGAIYYVFDFRSRGLDPFWAEIDTAIKARLLSILPAGDTVTNEERNQLMKDQTLLNAFFGVVDNDETLKVRGESVRLNGVIVTSIGDAALVSIVGSILQMVLYFETSEGIRLNWAFGLACFFFVCQYLLLPLAIKKHKKLSDAQLTYIDAHLREEVCKKLRESLQQLRRSIGTATPANS